MSVCPTVLELRFYGCCHPCFTNIIDEYGHGKEIEAVDKLLKNVKVINYTKPHNVCQKNL